MFTQILFNFVKAEYSVVDLPDPVGHEVNIIPLGKAIAFSTKSKFFHSIHNSFNDGICLLLSTILITTFSQ
jgi:Na+-translocating ferredoxin:NAD+ oxidoreductase RnfE subunit